MQKHIWYDLSQHSEVQIGQYIVPNFVSNALSIQATTNDYVLYSPGHSLLDDWRAKHPDVADSDAAAVHIVMPNHWHYMGVSAWLEAFPNMQLYASQKAIPSLQEKLNKACTKPVTFHALEDTQPPLPDGYEILIPPGRRASDAWLKKTDDAKAFSCCAWIKNQYGAKIPHLR